jgi:predicted membrane-bound mannosyltransferase
MTGRSERTEASQPQEGLLARPIVIQVRLNWEIVAYAALVIAAVGLRFWDLGARAIHHDESIHGWYAWLLYRGEGYDHNPLAHGPFQFFGTALVFILGGASDYTLRILPAVFGSALVALPFFLRHRLGHLGAFLVAAGIAFSPSLLFFSRFARNDIYMAFYTLGLVICLWRYIDERKTLYLVLSGLLLGLSFATKENAFLEAAIFIAFLDVWLSVHFSRLIAQRHGLDRSEAVAAFVLLLPISWAIAALWPWSKGLRSRLGLDHWHPAGDLLVVLGTLALPQFAAAIQVPLEAFGGIDDGDLARPAPFGREEWTRENLLGFFTIITLAAATACIGLGWKGRQWLAVAAAFYVPFLLLYTNFLTDMDGYYSGQWGSLDYWLGQQDVRRGNQPWFYYLTLLPSYEFLPLILAAPALFFYAVKGNRFERFLVYWVAATHLAYMLAGEKMPWISVHTSLPVMVLGGYALGRLLAANAARDLARSAWPHAVPLLAGAMGLTALALGVFGPEDGPWYSVRIVLILGAVVAILWLLWPLTSQRLVTVAASALVGALVAFTLFTGVRAAFQLGDDPRELFVYAQSSYQVSDVAEHIDDAARVSGLGHDLPVVVNGFEPWEWYLRDFRRVIYLSNIDEGYEPPAGAVVLLRAENEAAMQPFLDRYAPPIPYTSLIWFPEFDSYKTLSTGDRNVPELTGGFLGDLGDFVGDFAGGLSRASTWERWWDYLRHRDPGVDTGALNTQWLAYLPKQGVPELPASASPPGDQ